MASVNGTNILLYVDGVVIASQKGMSMTISQNLFDISTKNSSGWSEHSNGVRNATVSFDALCSTTGISAKELMNSLFAGSSDTILLVITGFDYPFVMLVDLQSSTITAPQEDATALSGQFVANGPVYYLNGTNAQLVSSWTNTDYDTFTSSGYLITSAINASGGASALSNHINVTSGDVLRVFVYLTLTSGEAPSLVLLDNSSVEKSNKVALVNGAQMITLTATGSDASMHLEIINTAASNFSTSNVYCFKI